MEIIEAKVVKSAPVLLEIAQGLLQELEEIFLKTALMQLLVDGQCLHAL